MSAERLIFVASRRDADRILAAPSCPLRAVISIVDATDQGGGRGRMRPPFHVRTWRHRKRVLRFDDDGGSTGPTRVDVEEIVGFVSSLDAEDLPLLVHCEAGVSRAAAAAVIARAVLGDDDVTADLERGTHRPSAEMLRLADEVLGTSLAAAVASWGAS